MASEISEDRTEERRRHLAQLWNLPETATWEDIDAASEENRRAVDEHHAATSEERRQNLARAYKLPPDATWDQIFLRWKRDWGFNALVMKSVVSAAIIPIIILVISIHWVAIMLSVLIFVVVAKRMYFISCLALEDEYWGNIINHPEIHKRAKNDGIYN